MLDWRRLRLASTLSPPDKAPDNLVQSVSVSRSGNNPLLTFASSETLGNNICCPSLIRVPGWVTSPLGRFYLYFSHHFGDSIRMAYADHLEGPWTTFSPGVLGLDRSDIFRHHVASPCVIAEEKSQQIIMFFHGDMALRRKQATDIAFSADGLTFKPHNHAIGNPYFQVFSHRGFRYAIDGRGSLNRAKYWTGPWAKLRRPLLPAVWQSDPYGRKRKLVVRHTGVHCEADVLLVFFTLKGDAPEKIYLSTVNLERDWTHWRLSKPLVVMEPEMTYEGLDFPKEPSKPGMAINVRQLRDPSPVMEEGALYLFYSVAGESGIASAQLDLNFKDGHCLR